MYMSCLCLVPQVYFSWGHANYILLYFLSLSPFSGPWNRIQYSDSEICPPEWPSSQKVLHCSFRPAVLDNFFACILFKGFYKWRWSVHLNVFNFNKLQHTHTPVCNLLQKVFNCKYLDESFLNISSSTIENLYKPIIYIANWILLSSKQNPRY